MASSVALLGLAASVAAAPALVPLSRFNLAGRDAASDLAACLADSSVETVVSTDDAYATDAAPFNLRLPYQPTAVVYPNTADDVAAAVKCGAASNVKVNARSGGHSYAAFGIGGEDGHLIVSLDNLRTLELDGDNAHIGAGNRLGDVALGLYNQGQRVMAHGTCPYVGIGGHAGHGGFGLPSRAWGTLMDQVVELEVVTADGQIQTANSDTNADLFWALRGAASSFGIVTKFTTITHAAPEHNVWASYTWHNLTAQEASDYMQAWQNWSISTPPELGLQIHINPAGATGNDFIIDGVWYGDGGAAESNSTFQGILDMIPKAPNATTVEDQSWLDSVVLLAGVANITDLNTTLAPDAHDTFFADSIFISQDNVMTQDSSDAFMKYLWEDALQADDTVAWFVIFDLWGGDQSYIKNLGADSTSFDARDSLYSIQVYGSSADGKTPYPDEGIPLIEGMLSAITDNMPDVTFKGYYNYANSQLDREAALAYYYPTHTEKLESIKATYDANDVFSFPQSVPPAA